MQAKIVKEVTQTIAVKLAESAQIEKRKRFTVKYFSIILSPPSRAKIIATFIILLIG